MKTDLIALVCACLPVACASGLERLAQHVVIVGLDGCRPEAVAQADAPVMQRLAREGAVCWKARAVQPTVTQVNWAAMLTGCMPSKNGISKHPVIETTLGKISPSTPSILQVANANKLSVASFLGHWKLYALETDTPGVHFLHSPYEARQASAVAAEYLSRHRPELCFVYMGDLDGAGHKYGWLSTQQLNVVTEVDAAVGKLLNTLRDCGMWDSTLLIITSDHGGHERSHSEGTEADITIPWIAAGPLVKSGTVIERTISTCDTAATAAYFLGVEPPAVWDGKLVKEILQ